MGLFDKKQKNNNEVLQQPLNAGKHFFMKRNSKDGIEIEYIQDVKDSNDYYDTTKLIIDSVSGHLANCRVAWYSENDTVYGDKAMNMLSRRNAFKDILVEIDFNFLLSDNKYVDMLMEKLLNKTRVERYLNMGLQEDPETPCGKYIGGVRMMEDGYRKVFNEYDGKMSHNSPEMKMKRREYKEMQERAKQNAIRQKNETIARLKSEIDDLSK